MAAMLACEVDSAIADLQHYLRAWRWRQKRWDAKLGYPSQCTFVRCMRPVVAWDSTDDPNATMDEAFDSVSTFILDAIDAEVDRLPTPQRAAIRLIYLRETDYAVYRSGRMDLREAARLCSEAEAALVPKLRVRGVVLGSC